MMATLAFNELTVICIILSGYNLLILDTAVLQIYFEEETSLFDELLSLICVENYFPAQIHQNSKTQASISINSEAATTGIL